MRVITAVENYELDDNEVVVFLAGGITNCPNWQENVINELRSSEDELENLVVINPRRENFPIDDPNASNDQITWEFNALEACDIFSMYFCDSPSDQPICMYELGRNIYKKSEEDESYEKRIVITCEKGYKRRGDVEIQTELATKGKVSVNVVDGTGYYSHANAIIESYKYLNSLING